MKKKKSKKDREVILIYYDSDGNQTNLTTRFTLFGHGLSCNGKPKKPNQ